VGARVVGVLVGASVGTLVGGAVGAAVGGAVGVADGLAEGALVGCCVGAAVARMLHRVSAVVATAGASAPNVGTERTGTLNSGCIVAAQAGATSTPHVLTPVDWIELNELVAAGMSVGLVAATTIIIFGTPGRPAASIVLAASTPAFRLFAVTPDVRPRRSSIGAAASVTLHPTSGCTARAIVAYVTSPTLMLAPYGPTFIESMVFLTKAVCCAYCVLFKAAVAWMTKTTSAVAHVASCVARAAESDGEPVGATVGKSVSVTACNGALVTTVEERFGAEVTSIGNVSVGAAVGANDGTSDGADDGN